MDFNSGIAIVGIWIGVGMVGWKDKTGGAVMVVAFFAMFATLAAATH